MFAGMRAMSTWLRRCCSPARLPVAWKSPCPIRCRRTSPNSRRWSRQPAGPSTSSLRRFWERVVDGPIGAAALAGRWREAQRALERAIEDTRHPQQESGTVSLVGAGPGDPDLLTLRALQALQGADIVFYDELI